MFVVDWEKVQVLKYYSVLFFYIVDQMLVHFYAEKLLFLRYCIREALNSIRGNNIYVVGQYEIHAKMISTEFHCQFPLFPITLIIHYS